MKALIYENTIYLVLSFISFVLSWVCSVPLEKTCYSENFSLFLSVVSFLLSCFFFFVFVKEVVTGTRNK